MKRFIFLICIFLPLIGNATSQIERDRMSRDLDVIRQTFEVRYAPADWKKIYSGWDLNEEIEQAKAEIQTRPFVTTKDYQRILLKFFNSTKDYHVSPFFYSTEAARLPFRIKSAGGGYFITWSLHPLLVPGDEILQFNKLPIADVVEKFKKQEYGNWDSGTDQALAEACFTLRIGSCGQMVPKGPVQIKVRHKKDKKTSTHDLQWEYLPELIPERAGFEWTGIVKDLFQQKKLSDSSFFRKDMSAPFCRQMQKIDQRFEKDKVLADSNSLTGHPLSHLPRLGKIVKDLSSKSFQAYIFEHKNKRFGFLRIPTYGAGNYETRQLVNLIRIFEEETNALVIDQMDNGGGSVFYMYSVATLLADRPLKLPSERMMITQEDVMFAIEHIQDLETISSDEEAVSALGQEIGGYPVDHDLAQSLVLFSRFVIDEWKEGRHFTEPGYVYGLDYIKPHPEARFTKPILFLVNELDFSCADFLPAILQDNKRATILGSKTAGAGGIVLMHTFPNLYGLEEYSYTGSIAERENRDPIENLGITPDVHYSLTKRDLQEKYIDYKKKILEILDKIAL